MKMFGFGNDKPSKSQEEKKYLFDIDKFENIVLKMSEYHKGYITGIDIKSLALMLYLVDWFHFKEHKKRLLTINWKYNDGSLQIPDFFRKPDTYNYLENNGNCIKLREKYHENVFKNGYSYKVSGKELISIINLMYDIKTCSYSDLIQRVNNTEPIMQMMNQTKEGIIDFNEGLNFNPKKRK